MDQIMKNLDEIVYCVFYCLRNFNQILDVITQQCVKFCKEIIYYGFNYILSVMDIVVLWAFQH